MAKGEEMCNSTVSLISAVGGGGCSTPRPGRFTPGKEPVPAGWDPGSIWMGAENLTPTGIRPPDGPAVASRFTD